MDISFANQALSVEYAIAHAAELERKVYPVPEEIDSEIAPQARHDGHRHRPVDRGTGKYLASWDEARKATSRL